MGKIIELSSQVANQIAAGEVVERPASVVKELIENALDAGAKNIEVRIKNGGFAHIVISDDGSGMAEDDVRLAIKRYATSKLVCVSDLYNLRTFGFRGEALPSIASISLMSIVTKTADLKLGIKALIEGGVLRDVYSTEALTGTRIEVRDLFFNVPARLKFARSHRTEAAEIDRLLRSFAFCNRQTNFKFFADNQLIFSTGGEDDDVERATLLLGRDTSGHLHKFEGASDLIKIAGVLASPMVIRKDTRGVVLFVNHRLVADKKLVMAVKTAFRSLLEVGRSPVCALNLLSAPDLVDINVHPRKAEVRFRDERRVLSHVISMISDFLAKTPWLSAKQTVNFLMPMTTREVFSAQELTAPSYNLSYKEAPIAHKTMLNAQRFSDLRIIGQVCATYLLTQGENGLVIIDQHAAHERIMYERFSHQKPKSKTEPLLIPIAITLSFSEMSLLTDHISTLHDLGILVDIFGKDTVLIRARPNFLEKADMNAFIKEILHDLFEWGQASSAEKLYAHLCATLACHASIRAGQRLSNEEIAVLLHDLDDTDFHAHCPHGRPLVKSFADHEIKKWFDRT